MARKPTREEKLAFVGSVVDLAIIQAAEASGLRKWLVEQGMGCFIGWQEPNAEELLLDSCEELTSAFEAIVPPDQLSDKPFSASTAKVDEPQMPWQECRGGDRRRR
jgi:hypothetical protein